MAGESLELPVCLGGAVVSIHARQQWRANLQLAASWVYRAMFQSTPASNGGRITQMQSALRQLRCVSIHARQQWRANHDVGFIVALAVGVSIHARQQWRANRCRPNAAVGQKSFNPRPPAMAGESIRGPTPTASLIGFNPRPPAMAGESSPLLARKCAFTSFNPRPPAMAGESPCGSAAPSLRRRFNPRPPAMAGESPYRDRLRLCW